MACLSCMSSSHLKTQDHTLSSVWSFKKHPIFVCVQRGFQPPASPQLSFLRPFSSLLPLVSVPAVCLPCALLSQGAFPRVACPPCHVTLLRCHPLTSVGCHFLIMVITLDPNLSSSFLFPIKPCPIRNPRARYSSVSRENDSLRAEGGFPLSGLVSLARDILGVG